MNAVEHRLNTAVKEILTTYRPAGVPDSVSVRVAQDTAKIEKPYIVISSENGESPHPAMRKLNLIFTSTLRTGEEETAPGEETHQHFVNALEAHASELAAALLEVQLKLRRLVMGATSEEIEDGRATASATVWTVWLQILPAED
jgi:hypothetical protein